MKLEVRRLLGAAAAVSVAAVTYAAAGPDVRAAAAGNAAPTAASAGQAPAQQPPQAPSQSQPPATPSQTPGEARQQVPTFQVEVNLVTTDVIARDRNGQFVADLRQDEIEVYEDGVKQTIASMTLVHGGRVINHLQPPPPPPQEGIVLPPTRPRNDAAGRIFLIVVDDLHLDFQNTGRIRELFKKISQQLIHEGDMFGIVSTGPSSLAIDLTYDRRRLDEAIKKISGAGLKPTEIIEAPSGADGPSEVRYRAHVAFSTAYDMLRNLERVQNRRKAIIYVSNGYDFNPFPESRYEANPLNQLQTYADDGSYEDPFARQGQQFADADLARELAELTRQANRANATIYTIDPRGLVGGPSIDENIDIVEWGNYVRKSQDSLRVIADLTGGIAIVNQNDFDRALKRIDAETSDYYMLGYYSSNPDPTRRTRKVEVKTTRDGVSIWARSSYSLRRPGQGSSK